MSGNGCRGPGGRRGTGGRRSVEVMVTDEDQKPPAAPATAKGLDGMSVAELESHIAQLRIELEEARKAVEMKRKYRSSLDDLFSS